ncbi:sulfite oxidase [soil metagenome]
MTGPRRSARLADPYNAGTPLDVLGRCYITPVEAFYVRSHGAVPRLNTDDHRLTADGLALRPESFALGDLLAALRRHDLVATLHCAGNRRAELSRVRPTASPLQWGPDAVGTAHWSGVRLADLLQRVGIHEDARHVAFEGADEARTESGPTPFGSSIPLERALAGDVLLADRMNDEPLTAQHGAPLRVVVPGYIGARSVKWLNRVTLLEHASDNWFQARDYRRGGQALAELELNSAITQPVEGAMLRAGPVVVRGYALAGSGQQLSRVELSSDGGATWLPAPLQVGQGADPWAWRLWRATLDLVAGEHELVVRAWDERGATQPADVAAIWNESGYMNSAWHRVRVRIRGIR